MPFRLRRALVRGSAILLLLGSAACQRGGDAEDEGSEDRGGGLSSLGGKGERDKGGRDTRDSARSDGSARRDETPSQPPARPPVAQNQVAPTTAADGQDRRVRIVNNSGQTIRFVYGSPVTQSNYGRDRIPTTTLSAGGAAVVDFNDNNGQCQYDLRVVLADGTNVDQRNVNICRVALWTVAAGGGTVR
jgi:hypothetical protein